MDIAGKVLCHYDIPVVGNLLTSTVQSGILIMSFAGEANVGCNIIEMDLATNKLLPYGKRIVSFPDVGVEIWRTCVVIRQETSSMVVPFDSPIKYFKRYGNDYLMRTSMRLYCISDDRYQLLSALDEANTHFDGEVILTAKGPMAVQPDGAIIYDIFAELKELQ
jgi:hypothetical protein